VAYHHGAAVARANGGFYHHQQAFTKDWWRAYERS